MLCIIPSGQTDAGSLQKHFLPFRVLLNFENLSKLSTKTFIFPFIPEEISLSDVKATLSAIIYHIRSKEGI